MLHKLRSAEGHTAQRLADEYKVSKRTIQRDLDLLISERFPVEQLGRGRGYCLSADFRMQQQALSAQEVLPLVLGGQIIKGGGQQAALGKLRNYVLNGFDRRLTDNLAERVLPLAQAASPWLEPISRAIANSYQALVEYQGTRDEAPAQRLLEPATLFMRQGAWYVDAFESASGQFKTFRLNRITSVQVLKDPQLNPRRPASQADFHPWDLGDEPPIKAHIEVGPELAKWLSENPPHGSQQLEGTSVSYQVVCRDAFIRWLLGLSHARLVGPAELTTLLRERLLEWLKQTEA